MTKKISSIHYASDWSDQLSNRHSDVWSHGIEILRDRFEKRYFEPLDTLINHTDGKIKFNCGFIVTSIDCLIIETLNQFYLGLKKTTDLYYRKNKKSEYKFNWQAFRDFFLHSTHFKDFNGNDDLVKLFFEEIRCGLLHQAESKSNSLINIKEKNIVTYVNPKLLSDGIIINRSLFHNALKLEFEKYLDDLRDPDSKNIHDEYLRDTCNKKMRALVE